MRGSSSSLNHSFSSEAGTWGSRKVSKGSLPLSICSLRPLTSSMSPGTLWMEVKNNRKANHHYIHGQIHQGSSWGFIQDLICGHTIVRSTTINCRTSCPRYSKLVRVLWLPWGEKHLAILLIVAEAVMVLRVFLSIHLRRHTDYTNPLISNQCKQGLLGNSDY